MIQPRRDSLQKVPRRGGSARGRGRVGLLTGMVACAWLTAGVGHAADEVRPAEAAVDAQMQQQLKQQAAHWEQLFTKLLYGELELIRSTCGDLSPKARRAIARAGEGFVKDSAMRLAEVQLGRRLRRPQELPAANRVVEQEPARDEGGAAVRAMPDPLTEIPTALAEYLTEHAGEERAAAYSAEVAARTARRRKAVVDEVVSMLDDELVLTSAQREAISATLLEHWRDSLALATSGSFMVNGRRMFRGVPSNELKPHLTELQRRRLAAEPADLDPRSARQELTHVWINQQLANVQGVRRDPWWFPPGEAAP